MHKHRNKDAPSDRILPNVITQDAGKKKSNELGFAFSKKDSFYACLPVLLEIEEKLCCLFQFSPKSVQCSVHTPC